MGKRMSDLHDDSQEYESDEKHFNVNIFMTFVSLLASLATIFIVVMQYKEFSISRIQNNWQLLTSDIVGNIGKGTSLKYLYDKGYNIVDIDVSCVTEFIRENGSCERPQVISNFNLNGPVQPRPSKSVSLFADGTEFIGCRIWNQNVIFRGNFIDFRCAVERARIKFYGRDNYVNRTSFKNSGLIFDGDIKMEQILVEDSQIHTEIGLNSIVNIQIGNSRIIDSELITNFDFLKFYISETEISGLGLKGFNIIVMDDTGLHRKINPKRVAEISGAIAKNFKFRNVWYWDDRPPYIDLDEKISLDRIPTSLFVCPSAKREKLKGEDFYEVFAIDDSVTLHLIRGGFMHPGDDEIVCEPSIQVWRKKSKI